jgi:hypothetical protein
MEEDLITLIEFEEGKKGVAIWREENYRLVRG